MFRNKPGRAAQGAAPSQRSFVCLLFLLLSLGQGLRAQADLGRMGVLSGDNLNAIRQKADAWFAANGDDGRKQFERWYDTNRRHVDGLGRFPNYARINLGFNQYKTGKEALEVAYTLSLLPSPSWAEIKATTRVSSTKDPEYQKYPGKGRVNCLRWDQNNPSHFFCGTAGGGVWESTNNGSSWEPIMDDETSVKYLEIKDMAVAPGGQELYALTSSKIAHTGETGGSSRPSDSFYRSTDGGANWELKPINAGLSDTKLNWTRILIDPVNPAYLYACGYGNSSSYRGLFISSDSGNTWNQTINAYNIRDMEIERDGNISYLHMIAYIGASGGNDVKVLRHKFQHPGSGGAPVSQEKQLHLGVIANPKNYQIAATGDGHVYALISTEGSSSVGTVRTVTLWRSDNYGGNYNLVTVINPPVYNGTVITMRNGGFQVSPDDPDVLYMGAAQLFRSETGGAHWEDVRALAPTLYVDHNDIQFAPNTSGEVVFDVNDSGIQKMVVTDNPVGLTEVAVSRADNNIEALQGIGMGVSRDRPSHILVGTQDNGSMLYDRSGQSSTIMRKVSGGDGQECLVHPTNPDILYSTVQRGKVYKSTDGTDATQTKSLELKTGQHYMPFIMDRNNADILYGADDRIWRTTNAGDSWSVFSSGAVSPANTDLDNLAQSRNRTYFYASYNKDFYYSVNGGPFVPSTGLTGFSGGHITSIASDPSEETTVYITLGGYTTNRVLKSTDNGVTFENHSSGLPSIPYKSLVLDPNYLGEAYVSGEYGVYYNADIRDKNSTWSLFGASLPNVCPIDLEYNSTKQKLYTMTTGRGLWEVETAHYYDAHPYCAPLGTTRNKSMGITKAVFQGPTGHKYITFNSSLNEGYTRFEAPLTKARMAGSILDLKLTPGGSSSPQRIRVWMDAGEDGIFAETPIKELIANGSSDVKTVRITVPSGHNKFRIRVGVDWQHSSGNDGPCGRSLYGEYEDYIIPIR